MNLSLLREPTKTQDETRANIFKKRYVAHAETVKVVNAYSTFD